MDHLTKGPPDGNQAPPYIQIRLEYGKENDNFVHKNSDKHQLTFIHSSIDLIG